MKLIENAKDINILQDGMCNLFGWVLLGDWWVKTCQSYLLGGAVLPQMVKC